ncbi:MAG: RdgB/HAM1 family non-canonical purine NTP pyrophosphatase [Acidobacteriota bacterium]
MSVAWPVILIATTNRGKIREITQALAGLSVDWRTLSQLPATPEPDETGTSFAENARIKACAYAAASGLPTVAEDSGLAIDALHGRPGVLSARYPGATYAEKFAGLYRELTPHPRPWPAHFIAALAFAVPDPGPPSVIYECEGVVNGEIVPAPRGSSGFGYDPIFAYTSDGRTGGELSDDEKLMISHRGRAFRQFREWLEGAQTLSG